jgi:hypothetical protein
MAFGAHIQSTGVDGGSGTSLPLAYGSNNTASNILFAACRFGLGASNFGCTDSRGNTYAKIIEYNQATLGSLVVWLCVSCAAGANTVTVTNTTSVSRRLAIAEYTGPGTFDKSAVAEGTSTTPNSGNTATTTQATELLFGAGAANNVPVFTAGSGYVLRQSVSNKMAIEDQIVTSTGTYAATFTLDGSDLWICAIITVYEAVGGGGTTRGIPFGTRGTAFNGGRPLRGIAR